MEAVRSFHPYAVQPQTPGNLQPNGASTLQPTKLREPSWTPKEVGPGSASQHSDFASRGTASSPAFRAAVAQTSEKKGRSGSCGLRGRDRFMVADSANDGTESVAFRRGTPRRALGGCVPARCADTLNNGDISSRDGRRSAASGEDCHNGKMNVGCVSGLKESKGEVTVGAHVVVVEDFTSNDKDKDRLRVGMQGVVKMIDDGGDAQIDFIGIAKLKWVFKRNFYKLKAGFSVAPNLLLANAVETTTAAPVAESASTPPPPLRRQNSSGEKGQSRTEAAVTVPPWVTPPRSAAPPPRSTGFRPVVRKHSRGPAGSRQITVDAQEPRSLSFALADEARFSDESGSSAGKDLAGAQLAENVGFIGDGGDACPQPLTSSLVDFGKLWGLDDTTLYWLASFPVEVQTSVMEQFKPELCKDGAALPEDAEPLQADDRPSCIRVGSMGASPSPRHRRRGATGNTSAAVHTQVFQRSPAGCGQQRSSQSPPKFRKFQAGMESRMQQQQRHLEIAKQDKIEQLEKQKAGYSKTLATMIEGIAKAIALTRPGGTSDAELPPLLPSEIGCTADASPTDGAWGTRQLRNAVASLERQMEANPQAIEQLDEATVSSLLDLIVVVVDLAAISPEEKQRLTNLLQSRIERFSSTAELDQAQKQTVGLQQSHQQSTQNPHHPHQPQQTQQIQRPLTSANGLAVWNSSPSSNSAATVKAADFTGFGGGGDVGGCGVTGGSRACDERTCAVTKVASVPRTATLLPGVVPRKVPEVKVVVVSGAGTSSVNGIYKLSEETRGGRPVWIKEDDALRRIHWSVASHFWIIDYVVGAASYCIPGRNDETLPFNVKWCPYQGGAEPMPLVTPKVEIVTGSLVTVVHAFTSDDKDKDCLAIGIRGRVKKIDDEGDAQIDFDGIGKLKWVVKRNFWKLQVIPHAFPGLHSGSVVSGTSSTTHIAAVVPSQIGSSNSLTPAAKPVAGGEKRFTEFVVQGSASPCASPSAVSEKVIIGGGYGISPSSRIGAVVSPIVASSGPTQVSGLPASRFLGRAALDRDQQPRASKGAASAANRSSSSVPARSINAIKASMRSDMQELTLPSAVSDQDVQPWLDAARDFELSSDFDVSASIRDKGQLDLASIMAVMKEESFGKRTIQALADKLMLHKIINNLGIPQMPALLAVEGSVTVQDVEKLVNSFLNGQTAADVILKPTHLSNGTGVVTISSPKPSERKATVDYLLMHVQKFLAQQADIKESVALRSLRPGFVAQPKYKSVIAFKLPLELRVLVLWGRARLALWWWGRGVSESNRNAWFVRRPSKLDGVLNLETDTWEPIHEHAVGTNNGFFKAIDLFRRHVREMAAAAEALATAVGAPFLRADFFVGSSEWGTRLNEVAYGCGADYRNLVASHSTPGGSRIVDDAPAIARILREGYRQCRSRHPPEWFLSRLGVRGQSYAEMSVFEMPAQMRMPLPRGAFIEGSGKDCEEFAVPEDQCSTPPVRRPHVSMVTPHSTVSPVVKPAWPVVLSGHQPHPPMRAPSPSVISGPAQVVDKRIAAVTRRVIQDPRFGTRVPTQVAGPSAPFSQRKLTATPCVVDSSRHEIGVVRSEMRQSVFIR
eukprot:TRINITY_DN61888_c0_g1_i1.p1 TRINITY_DN61888_c0_g1~~TRINITY_DN61888_c0_g1_i1.p1  ORF type:complete len:1589 (+),score=254.33 TRINITY_DN61888_c0_g1_i1:156-4922(+)